MIYSSQNVQGESARVMRCRMRFSVPEIDEAHRVVGERMQRIEVETKLAIIAQASSVLSWFLLAADR